MTDPIPRGEPSPHGKGKPPHQPVGKGHTDEEHRRESRTHGSPDSFPEAKDLADLPRSARSAHDQPPGGFRKGVPGRFTFAEKDAED